MSHFLKFAFVSLAGAALGACSSTGQCSQPLAAFCAAHDCPSYDVDAAQLRAAATSQGCYLVNLGTCGAYRFTSHTDPDGVHGLTRFYDATGALVAVVDSSLGMRCYITWGAVPPSPCQTTESIGACNKIDANF